MDPGSFKTKRHDVLSFGLTSKDNQVEEIGTRDITDIHTNEEQLVVILSLEDEQKKRIEDLEAKVKRLEKKSAEAEKRSALAEEEAKKEKEKSKRLEEAVNCVVCLDVFQSAHSLECGHSACYKCLRAWWTRPEEDTAPAGDGSTSHPPFQSAVYREKRCPQCKRNITRRPAPNYVVRDIVEIIKNDPHHTPTNHRDHRNLFLSHPDADPWYRIFPSQKSYQNPINEEDESVAVHHIASLWSRRVAGAALARRQWELDQIRENSRRIVIAMERMSQERAGAAAASRSNLSLSEGGAIGNTIPVVGRFVELSIRSPPTPPS